MKGNKKEVDIGPSPARAKPMQNTAHSILGIRIRGTRKAIVIIAGPLANYILSSLLIFFVLITSGQATHTNKDSLCIDAIKHGPAYIAGVRNGDTIIAINKKSPLNIRFSWIALGVKDPKIS